MDIVDAKTLQRVVDVENFTIEEKCSMPITIDIMTEFIFPFTFKYKFECKDNKFRVTFSDIYTYSGSSINTDSITGNIQNKQYFYGTDNLELVSEGLKIGNFIDNLVEFITTEDNSGDRDW